MCKAWLGKDYVSYGYGMGFGMAWHGWYGFRRCLIFFFFFKKKSSLEVIPFLFLSSRSKTGGRRRGRRQSSKSLESHQDLSKKNR